MNLKRLCAIGAIVASLVGCGGAPEEQASTRMQPLSSTTANDYTEVLQHLYVAYYGRPADPAGLAFWADYLARGNASTTLPDFVSAYGTHAAVKTVVENFGRSEESVALYGTDHETIVRAIYRNLFHREPDAEGLKFYVDGLNDGLISVAQAALLVANGALGADATAVSAKAGMARLFTAGLAPRGLTTTYNGLAPNDLVRSVLSGVDQRATDLQAEAEQALAVLAAWRIDPQAGLSPFASAPLLLPDLLPKYQSLCGLRAGVQSAAVANLSGHRDGRKDLLFTIWCDQYPVGSETTAPTVNGLVAFVQQSDGRFVGATYRLFGTEMVDMAGGVATSPAVFDFNGDGLDDIVYAVTGEDGRTLPQGYTGNNRPNVALMSRPDGSYSVQQIGWPGYNVTARLIRNRLGGMDVMTSSIGYGGKDQAIRLVNGQWHAVTDYDGGPAFSGSFYASTPSVQWADRAMSQVDGTTLVLWQQASDGRWTRLSSWALENPRKAPFRSWNGDPGELSIFSYQGRDYGFPSFGDHCRLQPVPGGQPLTLFAVPAQEVTGGYDGRFLVESSADFSWHLLLMAFSDAQGQLISSPLSLASEITNQAFFALKCGDFNGDGADDIVVHPWGRNAKPIIYLNDGRGGFASVLQTRLPDSSPSFTDTMSVIADVDGDGLPDLIYYPLTRLQPDTSRIQYQVFKGLRALGTVDVR